jgi:hypothetical protein
MAALMEYSRYRRLWSTRGPGSIIFLSNARPQQFFLDEVFEDAVGILVLEGPVPFSYSICNSWNAIDFYRHYLGENRDSACMPNRENRIL